jgi:DNA polymerase III subunit gamma/tau
MAIYQQARPTRFDQVVGQDHVKEPLVAAVRRGAVGHAYLFSGPRGVGKTTSARLLAMAVNCREGAPEERPCGVCESCTLVQRGSHPDVIELDAASNNSVDDVRDLREKVRLAPILGGTRVWILDEAHMLSRAAANALLKTLEEPPPGLLFVLATTESEKLPATVLSRCQHFRFRRLSDDEIAGKLARLVEAAGASIDEAGLALVARAADGAMRDAESLLERLLALQRSITRDDVEASLGLPSRDRLWALATALADGDLATLLEGAAELYRDGFAPRTVAEQLARTLRDALVTLVADGDGPRLAVGRDALVRALHALDDAEERFVRRGDLYALEVSLIRAQAALSGLLRESPAGDATLDPLAEHLPPAPTVATPVVATPLVATPAVATPAVATGSDLPAAPEQPGPASGESLPSSRPSARTTPPAPSRAEAKPRSGRGPTFSWHHALTSAGPQLKAFLHPAEASVIDGMLVLRYAERFTFHFNQLAQREQELYALVDEAGGSELSVLVEGPGGRLRRTVAGDGGGKKA